MDYDLGFNIGAEGSANLKPGVGFETSWPLMNADERGLKTSELSAFIRAYLRPL